MPVIPHLILADRAAYTPVITPPLSDSAFTLDSSGVAGFFGGDTAVSGIATVQLFGARRWGGFYNSPGAYEIAKKYGQLANNRLWDGLFPGSKCEPAELFELDGKAGPKFHAARSGSSLERTTHPAYLLARKAADTTLRPHIVPGRVSIPGSVTVIDLPHVPHEELEPTRLASHCAVLCILPIAASLAACVLCALAGDWWCFGSIALGTVASGVACLVIGSGRLVFRRPHPAPGAPPGDGILLDGERVLVLRGKEGAVNAITRGQFSLEYGDVIGPDCEAIGHCSLLLMVQFLVQLLIIPQGTLFGQLLFVATLAISWAYNSYLSSMDRDELQTKILLDIMQLQEADLRKFEVGTRTARAVFSCLALQSDRPIRNPRKLLDDMIPNDTEVWLRWKELVVDKLSRQQELVFTTADYARVEDFDENERELWGQLLKDAEQVYEGWKSAFVRPSSPSSTVKTAGQ